MNVKMLSNKYLVLASAVIIPIVFVAAVRIGPYCIDLVARNFPGVHYTDDTDTTDAILNNLILLFLFSLITFYCNVRTLRSIGKLTAARLSLECLLDLVAIPVGVLIMVMVKYNSRKNILNLTSQLNPLALAIFPLCKHLVIALTARKK